MPTIFEISLPSGETLKGYHWEATEPKANFVLQTGMAEYALRYDPVAKYLNSRGINVWVLDAFGQGLNAPNVEDLEKWPVGAFDKNVDAIALLCKKAKENGLLTTKGGHSMGSFMIQSCLQRYPEITDKTLIIGSNGGQAGLMAIASLLGKLLVHKSNRDKPSPFLTKLGLGAYSKAIKDAKTPLDWLSYDEENVKTYIADPYDGAMPTGGFWKEFLKGLSKIWKGKNLNKVSKKEKILILAGEEDPVGRNGKGPKWLEKTYKAKGIQNVALKLYPHMRHEIHNETNKQQVWEDYAAFILE